MNPSAFNFQIIQAGMAIGVSGHSLARTVSMLGQLGVVSGTALPAVLARKLQLGDPGGHLRRALAHFPIPHIAHRILHKYFAPWGRSGKPVGTPFLAVPPLELDLAAEPLELAVAAAFVEVFLAKENHAHPVGINVLERLQIPLLPTIYGAMLAHVDYLILTAGPPTGIPRVLEQLAQHKPADYLIALGKSDGVEKVCLTFHPARLFLAPTSRACAQHPIPKTLPCPKLVVNVPSPDLAGPTLESTPSIAAFIVDLQAGEPMPDLASLQQLGVPFFLSGGQGRPGKLAEAHALGAAGIQVATAFAFCQESGLDSALKRQVLAHARDGSVRVVTDPRASPLGFPLNVLQLENTLASSELYQRRPRICDLGFLRKPVRLPDGSICYRCPAEPHDAFQQKGGDPKDAINRKCLCNALLAAASLPQSRPHAPELPLVPASPNSQELQHLVSHNQPSYSAAHLIRQLLADSPHRTSSPRGIEGES